MTLQSDTLDKLILLSVHLNWSDLNLIINDKVICGESQIESIISVYIRDIFEFASNLELVLVIGFTSIYLYILSEFRSSNAGPTYFNYYSSEQKEYLKR